jgi:hypothetical protein
VGLRRCVVKEVIGEVACGADGCGRRSWSGRSVVVSGRSTGRFGSCAKPARTGCGSPRWRGAATRLLGADLLVAGGAAGGTAGRAGNGCRRLCCGGVGRGEAGPAERAHGGAADRDFCRWWAAAEGALVAADGGAAAIESNCCTGTARASACTVRGFCLCYKVLERGRLIWPSPVGGPVRLASGQLAMLWEGIDWRRPVWTAAPARGV